MFLAGLTAFAQSGPPSGYSSVVVDPATLFMNMILDSNGNPAFVYADGSVEPVLYFTRWDRTHGMWTTPAKITVPVTGSVQGYNLAYDSSIGAIGPAYVYSSAAVYALGGTPGGDGD